MVYYEKEIITMKQSTFAQKLGANKRVNHRLAIKEKLDDASYKDFLAAMNDLSISTTVIRMTISQMGYEIPGTTLFRWRKSMQQKGGV